MFRVARIWVALGVLLALWGLSAVHRLEEHAWVRPLGTRVGPVRILQFYATVGSITMGQKAQLCYGVENARSVHISPAVSGAYPSPNRCLEIYPDRTTHYMLLAEGFDGGVATRSFTLPVLPEVAPRLPVHYAGIRLPQNHQPQP
jgi:hypothetical protein